MTLVTRRPLTVIQREAFLYAERCGGTLVRYAGGVWSGPGEARPEAGASTKTIIALVAKGWAEAIRRDRKGRYERVRLK